MVGAIDSIARDRLELLPSPAAQLFVFLALRTWQLQITFLFPNRSAP
jgi:hypothetical protein